MLLHDLLILIKIDIFRNLIDNDLRRDHWGMASKDNFSFIVGPRHQLSCFHKWWNIYIRRKEFDDHFWTLSNHLRNDIQHHFGQELLIESAKHVYHQLIALWSLFLYGNLQSSHVVFIRMQDNQRHVFISLSQQIVLFGIFILPVDHFDDIHILGKVME